MMRVLLGDGVVLRLDHDQNGWRWIGWHRWEHLGAKPTATQLEKPNLAYRHQRFASTEDAAVFFRKVLDLDEAS